MKKLDADISSILVKMGRKNSSARVAKRIADVRNMWAQVVEEEFLKHTNSVSIVKEDDGKKLIVYVDESIYAAELNGRRELIKLKMAQKFQEDIEEFIIKISYGSHKRNYPYRTTETAPYIEEASSIPLSSQEMDVVENRVRDIEESHVRASLKKAMIADLEWKKGINEKNAKDG